MKKIHIFLIIVLFITTSTASFLVFKHYDENQNRPTDSQKNTTDDQVVGILDNPLNHLAAAIDSIVQENKIANDNPTESKESTDKTAEENINNQNNTNNEPPTNNDNDDNEPDVVIENPVEPIDQAPDQPPVVEPIEPEKPIENQSPPSRPECVADLDCPDNKLCENNKCVDNYYPKRSYSLWVYTGGATNLQETTDFINDFNQRGKKFNKKIDSIYLNAGEIIVRDGKTPEAYFYSSVNLSYFKNNLPSVKIHAMFESDRETATDIQNISSTDLAFLKQKLITTIEANQYIDGVHFDFEPINDQFTDVINNVNDEVGIAVSVAISNYQQLPSFSKLDRVVLMNYAHCAKSLKNFESDVYYSNEKFFKVCAENNANCQTGILITETSCEKETAEISIFDYFNTSFTNTIKFESSPYFDGLALYRLDIPDHYFPSEEIINELLSR